MDSTGSGNEGDGVLRTLSRNLAFMLSITIAGLPWWILLAALTLIIRRARNATLARRATEPPPGV